MVADGTDVKWTDVTQRSQLVSRKPRTSLSAEHRLK